MAISSVTNRVAYQANGTSAVFNFPYQFDASTELSVFLYNSSATAPSIITPQVLNTNYVISSTAQQTSGIYKFGANIIFNSTPGPEPVVVMFRSSVITNSFLIAQNGSIPSSGLNNALDHMTLIMQRLQDQTTRSLRLPDGMHQGTFDPTIPSNLLQSRGKMLLVNSSGTGFTFDQFLDGPYIQNTVIVAATNSTITSLGGSASGLFLQSNGSSAPSWQPLSLGSGLVPANNIVGVLGVGNGGTGTGAVASTYAQYGLIYASSNQQFATIPSAAEGNYLISHGSSAPSFQPFSAASISSGLVKAEFGGTSFQNHGSSSLNFGSSSLTLATTGATVVQLPLAGTLATLDQPEIFTNKRSIVINGSSWLQQSSALFVQSRAVNSSPAVTVRAISSQNSDLFQVLDSAGAPKFIFDLNGNAKFNHNVGTTEANLDIRTAIVQATASVGSTARFNTFFGHVAAAVSGVGAGIALGGPTLGSTDLSEYAYIWATKDNSVAGDVDASLHFATKNNNTSRAQRVLDMDARGNSKFFGSIGMVGSGAGTQTFTMAANSSTVGYQVVWPAVQGSSSLTNLTNDGAGNLAWTAAAAATPLNVAAKIANYNATTSDGILLVSSTNFTINLYGPSGNAGRSLVIQKTDANSGSSIVVAGSSALINSSATMVLTQRFEKLSMFCDGVNWFGERSFASPTSVTVQVLNSSVGTYTRPAGCVAIRVTVVGAGGGGGGTAAGVGSAGAGGGGGGGGYAQKTIPAPAATYVYAIGDGGAGATAGNNAGSTGATSHFGSSTVFALGGAGGGGSGAGTTATLSSIGGLGGSFSGGDIGVQGSAGQAGQHWAGGVQSISGEGGKSVLGSGGAQVGNSNAGGAAGNIYGGGGSGGAQNNNGGAQAGGKGALGGVIVEEFYS